MAATVLLMSELRLPTSMDIKHQGQRPSSLQSLLQKRALAKKRPTSWQNEHWSVPNVEAKPVEDAVTFTFNINNDTDNWNNFYKVCGDLSTKYGERATKRRAVVRDNDETMSSVQEKPHPQDCSTSERDRMIEKLLTNEIKSIEQTKSLLNLERIKLQMELLRLLDERLKVANQQDDTAVELLKLWQRRSIQNSMHSELAKRAATKEELAAPGAVATHQQRQAPLLPAVAAASTAPTPMETDVVSVGVPSNSLSLSSASASLLERIMQEQTSIALPTPVMNRATQNTTTATTTPRLEVRNSTVSTHQAQHAANDLTPLALFLRQRRREELAKQLGLR